MDAPTFTASASCSSSCSPARFHIPAPTAGASACSTSTRPARHCRRRCTRYQPLIDSLMAKDPARRPQTGADAARMIESALASLTPAPTRVQPQEPPQPQHPPGNGRSRTALAALVIAALVAWGGWNWWPRNEATPTRSAPAAPIAKVQRSIAVLPLVNLSRNPDNEYFSDGLAETMLDMLARVPDLTVIARTSSFAFKDKAMDVREIGKSLGASHLLEGSVQQSGEQLRITLQLIRTDDGAHLWSQRYDRPLADVFKVQDEVAAEVVRALEVALPKSAQQQLRSGGTENVAAYQQYLKGVALAVAAQGGRAARRARPFRGGDQTRPALRAGLRRGGQCDDPAALPRRPEPGSADLSRQPDQAGPAARSHAWRGPRSPRRHHAGRRQPRRRAGFQARPGARAELRHRLPVVWRIPYQRPGPSRRRGGDDGESRRTRSAGADDPSASWPTST